MNTSRIIETDDLWQHLNGDRYRIIGVAKYYDCFSDLTEIDLCTQYLRFGSFKVVGTDRTLDLFDYQGKLLYGGVKNFGELVFYSGNSGRWARTIKEFLAKKSNSWRFTKIQS